MREIFDAFLKWRIRHKHKDRNYLIADIIDRNWGVSNWKNKNNKLNLNFDILVLDLEIWDFSIDLLRFCYCPIGLYIGRVTNLVRDLKFRTDPAQSLEIIKSQMISANDDSLRKFTHYYFNYSFFVLLLIVEIKLILFVLYFTHFSSYNNVFSSIIIFVSSLLVRWASMKIILLFMLYK